MISFSPLRKPGFTTCHPNTVRAFTMLPCVCRVGDLTCCQVPSSVIHVDVFEWGFFCELVVVVFLNIACCVLYRPAFDLTDLSLLVIFLFSTADQVVIERQVQLTQHVGIDLDNTPTNIGRCGSCCPSSDWKRCAKPRLQFATLAI